MPPWRVFGNAVEHVNETKSMRILGERTSCGGATRFALVAWLCLAAVSPCARALTQEGRVGDVAFAVYAPDWTWQKRDVNVLVVLKNDGTAPVDALVEVVLPPGKHDDFVVDTSKNPEPLHCAATLPPKETVRLGFTGITAKDGVPLQTYAFAVEITAGDRETAVAYPLRTIRGEVVGGSRWAALLVPGGVALVWCVAFALLFRRFSKPGAWKKPSEPFAEPVDKEPWIDQNPIA